MSRGFLSGLLIGSLITQLIYNRPATVLLIGLSVGFLAGMFTTMFATDQDDLGIDDEDGGRDDYLA